jgi:ribosomal-protein-alanine N-acetyltransferase
MIYKDVDVKNTILKSERLLIRPLSIKELFCIKNNNVDALKTTVWPGTLSDVVLSAITKKIDKMQNIKEKFHKWYTYWIIINKENRNGIGFVGLKGINENGYTEIGYNISPITEREDL